MDFGDQSPVHPRVALLYFSTYGLQQIGSGKVGVLKYKNGQTLYVRENNIVKPTAALLSAILGEAGADPDLRGDYERMLRVAPSSLA